MCNFGCILTTQLIQLVLSSHVHVHCALVHEPELQPGVVREPEQVLDVVHALGVGQGVVLGHGLDMALVQTHGQVLGDQHALGMA